MKSSAFLAVAGVLVCVLIAGCVQTREASVASPPATSYQVGSFELQEGGSSQNVHRLWQQRFRGDPRIIGSTIPFNGQAFTVVGIMPRTFDVPSGVAIWVPKAG